MAGIIFFVVFALLSIGFSALSESARVRRRLLKFLRPKNPVTSLKTGMILDVMKNQFGIQFALHSRSWPENLYEPVRGSYNGHEITMQLLDENWSRFFRISLKSRYRWPWTLAVAKGAGKQEESAYLKAQKGMLISLDTLKDLLKQTAGQPLNEWFEKKLADMEKYASDFSLVGGDISILIRFRSINRQILRDAVTLTGNLASHLPLSEEFWERLFRMLLERAESADRPASRLYYLEALAKNYLERPETRALLEAAANGENVGTGVFALEALGRDIIPLLERTIKTGNEAEKREALAIVLQRRLSRWCLDLLLELFGETDRVEIKLDLIEIFRVTLEHQAGPMLVSGLSSPYPVIAQAAAEALAVCGNREAIGPLRALEENAATSGTLRQIALAAIGMIHRRLGLPEEGLLSLAENPALDGALSMDDDASGAEKGSAKPPDQTGSKDR